MDPELSYWIPKYILMWGDKPFAELGAMSLCMKALAKSQDIICYCNFFFTLAEKYIAPKTAAHSSIVTFRDRERLH